MNRRFWIEGNDQNSNCALTKNEISHKLRLAVGRGINKSMLEKEHSETGRNAKIVLGNESSDEEADEDVDQPAAQQFPVCDMCFGTARENYLRFVLNNLFENPYFFSENQNLSFHVSNVEFHTIHLVSEWVQKKQ